MFSKVRKNFIFDEAGLVILKWLKSICHVKTDAEVVRLGLSCLADLMSEDNKGSEIIIRKADGTEIKYHPVFEPDDITPEPTAALLSFRTQSRRKAA